jgi:endonuclease VIII
MLFVNQVLLGVFAPIETFTIKRILLAVSKSYRGIPTGAAGYTPLMSGPAYFIVRSIAQGTHTMEGPSLYLAARQLRPFRGKTVLAVSGNTKIEKERLLQKKVKDIFSWGKHLVIQFDEFALRTHFLLFGAFEAEVDNSSLTGDYKRSYTPRLQLDFENGSIKLFNCSVKFLETRNAKTSYDFTIDIMSPRWSPEKAFASLSAKPEAEIADLLLDQELFAGVGNIIKNEVLWRARVHPQAKVKEIPPSELQQLIAETKKFSLLFYKWRKVFSLRKHLDIYQKSICPRCGIHVKRQKTGKRNRISHFCPVCQVRDEGVV